MNLKNMNGIYGLLIDAIQNNKKVIPIEWAIEIRDNAQNIEIENEKLKQENSLLKKNK